MKIIEAYETVDGKIFTDEDEAIKHDQDCIGEEFDELLRVAISGTNGNVTHIDRHRMALKLLEDRASVRAVIDKLSDYLSKENEYKTQDADE